MGDAFRSIAAQVRAETTTRLRSPGTFVAALALVVLTFVWIPDPAGKTATITWTDHAGVWTTARYSASYLGLAAAMLTSLFLSLAGWYLVAGAVRRDRETGVGVILAATPITKLGYLAGKFAAHWAYLLALSSLAIPSAALFFAWHGVGSFSPVALLLPPLLLLPPSMALVAAAAILFDVVPALRGRAGPVLWFFTWIFVFIAIPTIASGGLGMSEPLKAWPLFDPTGAATIRLMVQKAIPEAAGGSISFGIHMNETGFARVDWPGIPFGGGLLAARLFTLLTAIPALGIAVLAFDRFAAPARSAMRKSRMPGRKRKGLDQSPDEPEMASFSGAAAGRAKTPRGSEARADGAGPDAQSTAPRAAAAHRALRLPAPVAVEPSATRAVLAEAWLAWQTAGLLRILLLVAAILAAALPAKALPWSTGAFLLLLGPALSEIAAREAIHGTRGLVGSQPGVPRSFILWKTSATALLVLALGVPAALRATLDSPARGAALLGGLLFIACFAAVAGAWTKGGKLFAGVHTAMVYGALNNVAALDVCAALARPPHPAISAAYVAAGLALVGLATVVEARRRGV